MDIAEQVKENLVRLRQNTDVTRLDDSSLVQAIEDIVRRNGKWERFSLNERSTIMNGMHSAIRGYDILDAYFSDPKVTEIMVNRFDEIYIEKDGVVQKTKSGFASKEKYHDIIQKIVSDAGKEVHQRTPIVDCRMKDGSRVNVVLHPISDKDAALTIRRFRNHIFTLPDLIANGTLSESAAAFLRKSVRAKLNIFISGGTGSGKTTLLNALANEIDRRERLITIEDARELNFENMDNWLALEARRPNAAGDGEITIRDLIRASLRMRPDRIIVGEVRGPEALDAIQAMNTGHDGSFSTGHANSVSDMQLRLETMILSGHDGLPLPAIRQQIASAIDLFVHVSRLRDHRRYVVSVEEPYWKDNSLRYHALFSRHIDAHVIGVLEPTGEEMMCKEKFYRAGEEAL
ncbi:CpaF family protein [Murdochiella vaginalis]|uniref:CpaF family protein n=1 Tax=Murdochiella vaginalis TaxID=1852373 RepID=UPI0008FE472D|nr:ATPase, T2SS/T4P/T4SS family [Murdochiella vaginalis]